MSTALALVEELVPDYESHPLDSSAVQLLLDLEAAGAAKPRALTLPEDMEYESVEAVVAYVAEVKNRANFYMGDALNTSETRFNELFAQLAHVTGFAEGTLMWVMSVCRDVPEAIRRDGLHWSHHAAVKSLPRRQQKKWLDAAEEEGLSATELAARIKAARPQQERLPTGDDEQPAVDTARVVEVAKLIAGHAEVAGENVIIRREHYTQLLAALGQE